LKDTSTKRIRIRRQRGYVMLVIMLFATAMVIGALSVARLYVGQIKRDRELELIHRGAQYSRAVKKYYKKFNRYPSSLDQLENTNQIRFLRRRYKDPMTGKDFKLLHFGEVQLQPKSPNAATNPGIPAANLATGDPNNPTGTTGATASASPITSAGGIPVAGGVGGAPIIGVESTSKKPSIFEFNNKNHYNEWEFIYDPSIDRGGLIKGPYNGQTLLGNIAGQPGQPGVPIAPPGTRLPSFIPQTPQNPNMTPQPQAPQSPQ
jgi:type II secretory pathway pseudopilin PulG